MLCIDNRHTDAYFNLAAEEYLLKNFRENLFMLWQNEPSVIIGKHQEVWHEVNSQVAQTDNLKIVRRFSGGGAVFHDGGNMNLTFIETTGNADFDRFSGEIAAMLSRIGIEVRTDERRGLYIDGYKVSGSAQCIHKDRAMYHATLLFSTDLNRLVSSLEALPAGDEVQGKHRITVRSVKSPVANLVDYLPGRWTLGAFRQYILDYFLSKDPGNRLYSFTVEDLSAITRLETIKYATSIWNYEGSFCRQ